MRGDVAAKGEGLARRRTSKKLKDLFREELSKGMKLAVLTNMLPSAMQDNIYTSIKKDTTYDTLTEK